MRTRSTVLAVLLLSSVVIADAATAQETPRGRIVSWGNDAAGAVSNTPTGNDFAAVAAGLTYSLALRIDGSLVSWGVDGFGQVSDTPTGNDFAAVAAGQNHSLALRSDGSLVSWGADHWGQVSDTPPGNDFTAVAAGGIHAVALRADGSLISWGHDGSGRVSNTPAGNDFAAVAAGNHHSVALRTDGSLVSWGHDGKGVVSNTPSGNDFAAVAAGNQYSVALRTDGSLVSWGWDDSGAVSDTPTGKDHAAVAAGWYHAVALQGATRCDGDECDIVIPVDSVYRERTGRTRNVVGPQAVPGDLIGAECQVTAVGPNNESVHLDNDLIVVSGDDSVTMVNVERAIALVITDGGTIVLGETIEVLLTIGNNDDRRTDYGIYSIDISVEFDCVPGDPPPPPPLPPPPPCEGDECDIVIPVDSVYRERTGRTRNVAGPQAVPGELVAATCEVFAVGLNNESVHLDNDLTVVSDDHSVTLYNVEREQGDVITGGDTIVLGETIEVLLTIGNNDDRRPDYGIYSGDISVKFNC